MKSLKKGVIILLLTFGPFIGYSQSKWTIGLNISPTLTKMNGYNSPHKYQPAYDFGIKSLFFLNDPLFLNFGLMYRQKKDVLSSPNTENLIDPNGNVNINNVTSYNTSFNYNFVSIPLSLNYFILKKDEMKISMYVSTGVELNYLNHVKTISDLPDGEDIQIIRQDDFKNNIGSSLTVGAGLLYEMSPKLVLSVKPEYSYDFYFGNKTEPKFHSLGLNIECHYKFN